MRAIPAWLGVSLAALWSLVACGDVGPSSNGNSNNHTLSVCGNGVVEWPEVCDDGNRVDDLTCSAACDAFCGNGGLDPNLGEACDGADLGGETCEDLGLGSGDLACSGCAFDTSGCVSTSCGNGVCEQGEHASCAQDCGTMAIGPGTQSTCAVLADGSAWCWGANNSYQLGIGSGLIWSFVPVAVSFTGLSPGPYKMSLGAWHACGVTNGGEVACWGDNLFSQLGQVGTEDNGIPELVAGLGGVEAVALGRYHSCALVDDGTVWCWGGNQSGCLGVDPSLETSPTPVQVTGIADATQIDGGEFHMCAVLQDGTARCWGSNQDGQLGNGLVGLEHTSWMPVQVSGLSGVISLSAGHRHSCAIVDIGTVRCWGNNENGGLGDGTTVSSPLPVAVQGIDSAEAVCAGGGFSCAALTTGKVLCWGFGYSGSLGNGSYSDSSTPVEVRDIATSIDVKCGGGQACAILVDGSIRCWGWGQYGQLGNGLDADSPVPVQPIFE